MLKENEKNFIKSYTEKYFEELDYSLRKPITCLNPDHDDKHPSMSFYKEGNLFKCFSCNFTVDIFKMVELQENIKSFQEQVNFLIDRYDINLPKYTNKKGPNLENKTKDKDIVLSIDDLKLAIANLNDREDSQGALYLKSRGIFNKELYKGIGEGIGTVIFPMAINEDGTGITSFVERNIRENSNIRYKQHGIGGIYNVRALDNEGVVFITEGVFDALSFLEVGYDAISISGVGKGNILIDTLKKYESRINKTEFIIAFDNDIAGIDGARILHKKLKQLGKKVIIAYKIYDKYKDANDYLLADREKFTNSVARCVIDFDSYIQQEKDEYIENNSVSGYFSKFIENTKNSKSYKPIPTGFIVLDNCLKGGLYSGLYVIGAISSLGKTTFTLQLSEQIAENNDKDILIFSLEMSKDELIAKSLSRKTYDITRSNKNGYKIGADTLTTLDILKNDIKSETQKEILQKAIREYEDYHKRIFIYEADDNITGEAIRRIVEEHIKNTGRKPVVIIDYLQIVPSEDKRLNDKQVADRNVSLFKRISRDFTLPVFVISSLNRGSYSERVTMASFKESGGIEYGCDVLFGLNLQGLKQYDNKTGKYKAVDSEAIDKLKQKNPREIELTILKNRNGEINKSVNFKYITSYNKFIENYEEIKK